VTFVICVAYIALLLVLSRPIPPWHLKTLAPPAGFVAGALWNVGFFFSIFATEYLGFTVGFPLTQVCTPNPEQQQLRCANWRLMMMMTASCRHRCWYRAFGEWYSSKRLPSSLVFCGSSCRLVRCLEARHCLRCTAMICLERHWWLAYQCN
jgi:hypothetical protein